MFSSPLLKTHAKESNCSGRFGSYIASLLLLALVMVSTVANASVALYWSNENTKTISHRNVPGAVSNTLIGGADFVTGIAVDNQTGKIYWADPVQDVISRANLADGSAQQVLLRGPVQVPHPFDVRVDSAGGKLYWADDILKKIRRSNLDGSNVQDVLSLSGLYTGASIFGIDLDLASQQIYWSDRFTGNIQRANLDGSGITTLISGNFFGGPGPASPFGLRLDLQNSKIYWADTVNDKIQRANLDGTLIEDIVTKNDFLDPNFKFSPFGLAIDDTDGRLYWTNKSKTAGIFSATLDGQGILSIETVTGNPLAIEVVTTVPNGPVAVVGACRHGALRADKTKGPDSIEN